MGNEPKNIVICLDGTGNQIEENLSNVLKLYRTLKKSEEQVVFYDQGVGTLGQKHTWGRAYQSIKNLLGLGFGLGLDKNVIQAYEFIVKHYQEYKPEDKKSPMQRDKIFIFGFSRGAHTARVLAGMIYEIGILKPDETHLIGAALTAYKQTIDPLDQVKSKIDEKSYEGEGANFRRVAGTIRGSVNFLGVWDTVSSVYTPNSKNIFPLITRENLPHTLNNPSVLNFRHAMAIDEFRRMFRLDSWMADQEFKPNPYTSGDKIEQNAVQMWFAGCHSDIGGGYKRSDSGLSQYPLIWMIGEAKEAGLVVFDRMSEYVTGVKPWTKNTKYLYPEPDVKAPVHTSLSIIWSLLEIFPKSSKRREWPKRKSIFGLFYFPLGEHRFIPKDANIHDSVYEKIESCADYKPVNVPPKTKD